MSPRIDRRFGIPLRTELRLRAIAFVEGAIFFALLLIAAVIRPIWLAATILVTGMFGSGFAWLALIRCRRQGKPVTAHKIPKA